MGIDLKNEILWSCEGEEMAAAGGGGKVWGNLPQRFYRLFFFNIQQEIRYPVHPTHPKR